ncbi:hypothetical protein LJ739_01045 [Aestuariibacter halophilus]|uniref:DUF2029 domain-containing protein n=1 Tax=Fluctibacter halophilus TaxID=226011 RepID=A0ABS8G2Z7_9ALTE|nr:hypothetical protein [Aestuariibacter halophilus]MCC2614823.1 hypothetical protein [Aestuariibacter halophilus]
MKPYTVFFEWQIVLLESLVVIGLSIFLGILATRVFVRHQDRMATVISFLILCFYTKVATFFPLVPFFPDTLGFAELVESNDIHSSSLGVILYYWVSTPLRWLSGFQIELFLYLQQCVYLLGCILIWLAWRGFRENYGATPGNYSLYLFLVLLYPSTIMFIAMPLREYLMILGFGLFLYGLYRFQYNRSWGWLIAGGIITIMVRPQLVILYPLMMLVATQKSLFKLSLLGGLLLALLVPVFEWVTGYHFEPSFFAFLRERGTTHYAASGMTYGQVDWKTYWDILLDLPALFLQFVLSPLPVMHSVNPFQLKLMLLDVMFVMTVLAGAILCRSRASTPLIRIFIVVGVIFSIWEFYLGGAVRHRMPLVLMLLPVATAYYTYLGERIRSGFENKYTKG